MCQLRSLYSGEGPLIHSSTAHITGESTRHVCLSKRGRRAGYGFGSRWEALRWRELEWGALPHTTRKGTIPYLTVREAGRLDCAMTNRGDRPHLVKSYKGMESPGFNGHVYTGTIHEDHNVEHVALRWVMKRHQPERL